jgi:hypothetical protein
MMIRSANRAFFLCATNVRREVPPCRSAKGHAKEGLDMRTRISNNANARGSMRKFLILFTAAVLASALAVADGDPPNRAARLSYAAGTVTFQPDGEETDWAPADLNRALTTGDKLWIETGGRAEIQTINSAIRLNGHTNFSFLTVDDTTTQIQLSLGVMLIRLRGLDENETYEVDTPQAAFTLLRPGVYRVEVNEVGDTTVITVRGGDGEVTADGKATVLHVNEQVVLRGTDSPTYDKHGAPNPDEFDAWAADRDRRVDSSISVTKVAPGVVGVSDLDVAGAWRPAPTYGNVWFPHTVVADWAPYRFGHWGFVEPWGWTWIDDAPWGYAPFHYGRWVMVGGTWGWAPGPIAVRAIYAPALVSFIGGVEVVGVADPVSWVALSWGEPWYPSYGVSWGYYNRVNLCGTVFAAGIIAGVWGGAAVNLSFGHDYRAVNVVGRGGFAGGHAVGREFAHRDHFGGHAFDHAGSRREGVRGIGASREGRFGGHAPLRAGSRGIPPGGAMSRGAVTRHAPAAGAHGGGNFRGAGVAAKHGPSANGGHAGSYKPAANSGRPGGGGSASHNTPGGKSGASPSRNTPGGGKSGASPSRSNNPAGGKSGASPSHSNNPAGGKSGASPSRSNNPAGGKNGASPSHSNTPAGGKNGASPSRSNTPAGGNSVGSRSNTPSGASKGASPSGARSTPTGGSPARPSGGASPAVRSNTPAGGSKAASPAGGGGARPSGMSGGGAGARTPVGGGGGAARPAGGGGQAARPAAQAARPAPQASRPAPQASRPAPQASRPAPQAAPHKK